MTNTAVRVPQSSSEAAAVHRAARDAYTAGLCAVPPAEDGSKAPIAASARWREYQARRPNASELRNWFPGRRGLGIVLGAVSGGVDAGGGEVVGGAEAIDFDDAGAYHRFKDRAARVGLGLLVERVEAGYCEDTPKGGVHWLYRCAEVGGSTKLAVRPAPTEDDPHRVDPLIETKGEGGFLVVAPSGGPVHPSGRPYVLRSGSFAQIVVISPEERRELLELAASFDEREQAAGTPHPTRPGKGETGWVVRPGDAYKQRERPEALLEAAGWTRLHTEGDRTYWRRPGKARGISATTFGNGLAWCFTTSTPLPSSKTLDAFAIYTHLEHRGDFKAAARTLHAAGYGDKAGSDGDAGDGDDEPEEWPALRLAELPSAPAFPVQVFPPPLEAYARELAATLRAPLDFVGAAMMATAASAIGQSVNLRLTRTWTEAALFFLILVARPGTSKSPVIRSVVGPLAALDRRLREKSRRDRESWEGAKARHTKDTEAEPPGPEPALLRAIVKDVTRAALVVVLQDNPRGVLCDPDEAKAWVNSFDEYKSRGGSDRQFWLSVWGCSPVSVDRKGGRESYSIAHPYVTVLAGLQPSLLAGLVDERGLDDGFTDRCLFVYPDASAFPPQRWTEAELSERAERDWAEAIETLFAIQMVRDSDEEPPRPYYVRFTETGGSEWVRWFNDHADEVDAPDFPDHQQGAWSKLRAHAARFALTLSLLRWACDPTADRRPGPVTAEDVRMAIALADYFKSHLKRASHEASGGLGDRDARVVLAWIRRRSSGTFREADVAADLRHYRERPRALTNALAVLTQAGVIRRSLAARRKGPGRRPTPAYEVHPDLRCAPGNPENTSRGSEGDAAPPDSGISGNCRRTEAADDREVIEL